MQYFLNIEGCRISFNGRVRCKDDLRNARSIDPLNQVGYAELFRTDTLKRGDYSVEHMEQSMVLAEAHQRIHILRLFDNANTSGIPRRIAANAAYRLIGKSAANRAGTDVLVQRP